MAIKYVVRHGAMQHLGEFDSPDDRLFRRGTRVVAQTPRGIEAVERR